MLYLTVIVRSSVTVNAIAVVVCYWYMLCVMVDGYCLVFLYLIRCQTLLVLLVFVMSLLVGIVYVWCALLRVIVIAIDIYGVYSFGTDEVEWLWLKLLLL